MKLLIIGFGHAGQAYLSACLSMSEYDQVMLVDQDPAVRSKVPEGILFSTEIPNKGCDLAIIATPPSTHYRVLQAVHDQATRIILEKPFALEKREIDQIFALGRQGKIFFSIHAVYGDEIELARKVIANGEMGKVLSVAQLFCDPYWPDGPKNLGGPFWDSIYNALGVLNSLFDDVEFEDIIQKTDREDCFCFFCHGRSHQGHLTYSLTVDWRRAINLKVTEISGDQRKTGILVNHSQQCLSQFSGLGFEFSEFVQSRLASHYQSVVAACLNAQDLEGNYSMAKRISEQVVQIAEHSH